MSDWGPSWFFWVSWGKMLGQCIKYIRPQTPPSACFPNHYLKIIWPFHATQLGIPKNRQKLHINTVRRGYPSINVEFPSTNQECHTCQQLNSVTVTNRAVNDVSFSNTYNNCEYWCEKCFKDPKVQIAINADASKPPNTKQAPEKRSKNKFTSRIPWSIHF